MEGKPLSAHRFVRANVIGNDDVGAAAPSGLARRSEADEAGAGAACEPPGGEARAVACCSCRPKCATPAERGDVSTPPRGEKRGEWAGERTGIAGPWDNGLQRMRAAAVIFILDMAYRGGRIECEVARAPDGAISSSSSSESEPKFGRARSRIEARRGRAAVAPAPVQAGRPETTGSIAEIGRAHV